ncbi:hypothetical protein E3N88_33069 [Mikania micrantha]|uniref:Uncharacterized protein n=1 Tax=Mikania micrantha TaxID=192012 RepID=A0A5N6MA86_9ASTR|nr:hypothetical protein E3N88_33069 [Mikania micrantha]
MGHFHQNDEVSAYVAPTLRICGIDSTREMMNVGGNRARNGVTDCPESRNEENFQSIELLDSSRIILLVPVYERSCYSKTTGSAVDGEVPSLYE